MTLIKDVQTPKFHFIEQGSSPTAPAGTVVIFAKTDGKMYAVDDAGNEAVLGNTTASTKRGLAFYVDGALAVETSAVSLDTDDVARTATGGRLSVDVAPVGAAIIIQIKVNGSAMFSSAARPTIPAGSTSATFAAPDLITSIPAGATVSEDIEQVGSSTAGENLRVTMNCTAS